MTMASDLRQEAVSRRPYLSFVIVSRNDNHGGDLTRRTNAFLNSLAAMCRKFRIRAELIVVEWNPPGGMPPLKDELSWPGSDGYLDYRIVRVPPEIHRRLQNSEHLPLFQMIGKNVGIRRARGEFVLATNLDLLFSDELGQFFAAKQLKSGCFYRVDRFDAPTKALDTDDIGRQLQYCAENVLRVNAKVGTLRPGEWKYYQSHPLRWQIFELTRKGKQWFKSTFLRFGSGMELWMALYPPHVMSSLLLLIRSQRLTRWLNLRELYQRFRRRWFSRRLHTNGCGDFTLLSRDDWFRLRGYPEWEIFSWHLDSLLLYQASSTGLDEIILPAPIYHIEHTAGWNPDDSARLWETLSAKGIPYLSNEELASYRRRLYESGGSHKFNRASWGMRDLQLIEQDVPSVSDAMAAA